MPKKALAEKRPAEGRAFRQPPGKSGENGKPGTVLSPVKALAANMRHLRRERFPEWGGQRRFAEFLGISPNDLCVYESGRALPNDQRLEDMAKRLDLPAESLLRLLPGADPGSPSSRSNPDASGRNEDDEMRREIARLEIMNDILRKQLDARETRVRELEEANLALRSLVYSENTPEGAERRRRLLERLESSFIGQGRAVF